LADPVQPGVPCAKGIVCYCLDEFSKGRGARTRLTRLRDAIMAIASRDYQGLEVVFDQYLFPYCISDANERSRAVTFLRRYWFDPGSPDAFFAGFPPARIYAEGVLKALELSLNGRRVVPLNAWWILDTTEPKMLVLADVDNQGVTVGGRVTLLVVTPRPSGRVRPRGAAILGQTAQAWVSERQDNQVVTVAVRDLP
jgi:hypothetical protein